MPTFVYKVKKGPDQTVEGELNADSRASAVASLDAMGYSPIWVREKPSGSGSASSFGRKRIGQRDITLFTRQLASLTRSGVPILKALRTIGEQTETPALQKVVKELERSIRDGRMLSEAMTEHPALFPDLYVNMVRSGETGGVLDTILDRLSDAREREDDFRRKVRAAAAYPLLVLVVGIVTIVVLFTFFLPRIAGIFETYGYANLPLPTRIIIGISGFFSDSWYWMVLGVALVIAVLRRLAALESTRAWLDRLKLKTPILGRFLAEAELARFARTLALLIQSGIPIDRCLLLSANTLGNRVLREEVLRIREGAVSHGLSVSDGLKKARHFPPLVANMASVGEEAGRLDDAMTEVATFYEKEVEVQSRMATSLLEPLLILGVGAVVGFIVAAMLLPIFELGTAVR